MPRMLKYGGPTIADLDRDGLYDLIFVHHGPESVEVYFNDGDVFTKSSFRSRRDNHAITPFLLPGDKAGYFTLIPGGNNGIRPNFPVIYRVTRDRTITNVTAEMGVAHYTARGRTVVFMPLQQTSPDMDVVYLNARADPVRCPGCADGQYDPFKYAGGSPVFRPRVLKGFKPLDDNSAGMAVDTDNDGVMELLTWRTMHLHKVVGNFKLRDVSKSVLGEFAFTEGVAAVAEIDFDNDGDFDLYVARDKSGNRHAEKGKTYPDLLLENRDGKFVNVADEAGIPGNRISRGVTVGDFNNDGYMDLYVTVLRGKPDMLLLNNGNSTFRKLNVGFGKNGASGDNAMAVDYDNDGWVDLIRSEGDWSIRELGGQFRILKNVSGKKSKKMGNWIKVRVGEIKGQTSLHAVVSVVAGKLKMRQRVGPAGVQTPASYFDTLHFGIGTSKKAVVTVTWLNGVVRRRRVQAGKMVKIGKY